MPANGTPFILYDIGEREFLTDKRTRMSVQISPTDHGEILIDVCENASSEGPAIALDWTQVNTLHEHLGRLLLESGVTQHSPMGVESEAVTALREARVLLRAAFHAIDRGDGQATAIQIARYLLSNNA